jgi:hypothetical protein
MKESSARRMSVVPGTLRRQTPTFPRSKSDIVYTGKCQFKSTLRADLNCAYLPTVVL